MNELTSVVERGDKRPFAVKMKVTWYFEKWWEKGFLILCGFALIYSIARIIFQGFW